MSFAPVFTLVVVPGTKYRRELYLVSIKPGVGVEILSRAHEQVQGICKRRNADYVMITDANFLVPLNVWERLRVKWIEWKLKGGKVRLRWLRFWFEKTKQQEM